MKKRPGTEMKKPIYSPKLPLKTRLIFPSAELKRPLSMLYIRAEQKGEPIVPEDVAASFQKAVCDILVDNTIKAAKCSGIKTIALAGGVAANKKLRETMQTAAKENHMAFYCPPLRLCTDNAVMIGCAGYYQFLNQDFIPLSQNSFATLPL